MKNNSLAEYKNANKIIDEYIQKKIDFMYIHYARQNCFVDAYEKGPRVIAIVVLNAKTEQMRVFSLKKSADKHNCDFFQSTNDMRDIIEKEMLQAFYDYVAENPRKKWLHWNMKNNNFGFSAIRERFENLNGNPGHFEEEDLINISVLLRKKYGTNFAQDCVWNGQLMGKMYDIFTLNEINNLNILNGEQESKEYILENITPIEQSIIEKVKAFRMTMEKVADNSLKTRGNVLKDVYGISIRGIAQYIHDNALLAMISSLLGAIIVNIICWCFGM